MSLAQTIVRARQARQLSQGELAEDCGVSRSAVAQWETGRARPDSSKIALVASVLGITADELLASDAPAPSAVPPAGAFTIRDLSVLAYARGFTLWHYRGLPATVENMSQPGFFAQAQDMLHIGDILLLMGADCSAIRVVVGTVPTVTLAPLNN